MPLKTRFPWQGLNFPPTGLGNFMAKLALFILSAFPLVGCGAVERPSPLLNTSLGPTLEELWGRHGGLASWKKYAGARFDYLADINGVNIQVPGLLFVYKPSMGIWLQAESDTSWSRHKPESNITPNSSEFKKAEHLAMLTASFLFHLPFSIEGREWSLRRALSPGKNNSKVQFEASHRALVPRMGPFLIRPEPDSNGLDEAHYLCRHPGLPYGAYRVEFHEYQVIQGIRISTSRKHYHLNGPGKAFALPGNDGHKLLMTEKLSSVRFLTEAEVQKLLENNQPK